MRGFPGVTLGARESRQPSGWEEDFGVTAWIQILTLPLKRLRTLGNNL